MINTPNPLLASIPKAPNIDKAKFFILDKQELCAHAVLTEVGNGYNCLTMHLQHYPEAWPKWEWDLTPVMVFKFQVDSNKDRFDFTKEYDVAVAFAADRLLKELEG